MNKIMNELVTGDRSNCLIVLSSPQPQQNEASFKVRSRRKDCLRKKLLFCPVGDLAHRPTALINY